MIKKLTVTFLFFVSCFLFIVTPALAQSTPISCSAARSTDRYTKVVVEPRLEHTVTIRKYVPPRQSSVPVGVADNSGLNFVIQEDFSRLGAIFAASNSNFLESEFQDQAHKQGGVIGFGSQEFNEYQGPGQKAAPQYMTDELRIKFVDYVNRTPALKEAADIFTDVNGENPRTVATLVSAFGVPNPPSHGGDSASWQAGWAPYWNKIPTAVNEFFLGFVNYGIAEGDAEWQAAYSGGPCNYAPYHQHFFVMPDYFRAASVTDQINQVLVPKRAQSSLPDFVADTLFNNQPLANLFENSKSAIKNIGDSAVVSAIKKILRISFNFVDPLKEVYAQQCFPDPLGSGLEFCTDDTFNPTSTDLCPAPIPVLPSEKEGVGPYCGFQAQVEVYVGQTNEIRRVPNLEPGETCTDGIHCTFYQTYETTNYLVPDDSRWNGGRCSGDAVTGYYCETTIRLYPVYFFPFLAPTWNNSTYSDSADNIAILGLDRLRQETGRPGSLGFFVPKAVEGDAMPQGKNLPSQDQSSEGPKQRFFGAVDNLKSFVKDRALKPCELQRYLGVANACQ